MRPNPTPESERGAVLVETALTAPIVLLMIFAVVEFGFMFKDYVTLGATAQESVRAATVVGNDINADHHILEVAIAAAAPLENDDITKIIVFWADTPDAEVPASCLTSSQNNAVVKCNLYEPSSFVLPLSDFGCDPLANLDRYWCPSDRVVAQRPANGGPPDFIGIYIEIERTLLTGFFGKTQTLDSTEVLRLEPRDI